MQTFKFSKTLFLVLVAFFTLGSAQSNPRVQVPGRPGHLEEFKDGKGQLVAQNYFDEQGVLRSHKTFEPQSKRYEEGVYNHHGRILERFMKEESGLVLFHEKFNGAQQLVERTDYEDLGTTQKKRVFEYDERGRLIVARLIKPSTNNTTEEVHYRYRSDDTLDAFDYFKFFEEEGVRMREPMATAFYDDAGKFIVHRVGKKTDDLGQVVRRLHYRRSYRSDPDTYVHLDGNLLWLIQHYGDGGTDVRVETNWGRVLSLESYVFGSCPEGKRCMKGRYEPINGAGVMPA